MAEPRRRPLFVDSRDRYSGTTSNFSCDLRLPATQLLELRLESASIPYVWYNVPSIIYLPFEEQAGGPALVLAAIAPDQYTGAALAAAAQTALNAASPNLLTYTVAYDPVSFGFTISATGNFRMRWTTYYSSNPVDPVWQRFGANTLTQPGLTPSGVLGPLPDPDSAYAASWSSSGVAILGERYLWLSVGELAANDMATTNSASQVAVPLLVNGNYGDYLQFSSNGLYDAVLFQGCSGKFIKSVQVILKDSRGQVVDLRGADMALHLSCRTSS